MQEIVLTRGQAAIVDDGDFARLSAHKWLALKVRNKFYAARSIRQNGRKQWVLMHREIAGNPSGMEVDHENGNSLDNRRQNLRACEPANNHANISVVRSRSGFKGVTWYARTKKWMAQIGVNYRVLCLGYFGSAKDAALAYDAAARKHFGAFAKTNFAQEVPHAS